MNAVHEELGRLGTATVYEASGRRGLVDLDLQQVIPGSRACGPARTVMCGQGDNLMVHAAMDRAQPGDVLVLTMPDPEPVALIGDLLVTQAKARGVAALLVDAAVRDVEELRALGVPVWTRWVRVRGAVKSTVGRLDETVEVGGTPISPGDAVVLDTDGVVVVAHQRVRQVLEASHGREDKERAKRVKLQGGELSYDLDGLRALVEGERRR